MAEILRGKHKGKQVEIRQWCNDWVTVDTVPPQDSVLSITNLKFNIEESARILMHENNRMMEERFEFKKDRFVRRRFKPGEYGKVKGFM